MCAVRGIYSRLAAVDRRLLSTLCRLDRHRLLEAGVSGLVDDAHPAAAELGDDRIRPEGSAGREGHGEAILLLDSWRAGNMWGRVDVRVDARHEGLCPSSSWTDLCAPSMKSSARPRLRIMLCGPANAVHRRPLADRWRSDDRWFAATSGTGRL